MKNTAQKANAPKAGGVKVDRAGGRGSARECASNGEQFTTDEHLLSDKSTETEIQLEKMLALLRRGAKTTIDLRLQGIMMPAARVHSLRKVGFTILTEKVNQVDERGFNHPRVARYTLTAEPDVGG